MNPLETNGYVRGQQPPGQKGRFRQRTLSFSVIAVKIPEAYPILFSIAQCSYIPKAPRRSRLVPTALTCPTTGTSAHATPLRKSWLNT
jgi:hypothetical protein